MHTLRPFAVRRDGAFFVSRVLPLVEKKPQYAMDVHSAAKKGERDER